MTIRGYISPVSDNVRMLPGDAAGRLVRLGLVSRGFQQKQRNTKAPM